MNWHSDICYICFDEFSHSKPRLFSYGCIHATCRDCLILKVEYAKKKEEKTYDVANIICDYGRCHQPILKEALCRNFQIYKINDDDALFIYNFPQAETTDEGVFNMRDNLQQILIKSQGFKVIRKVK
jgi:hypothetical protein